ncbi:DUF3306 domain-containing protein [Roseobacter weihaiensis]|uniref:DUF3306 domain-containing protein n=1 Tax=Roseobacter weihaiensis TaxID=2763262 RepID=UPI001D0B1B38|nr:DUF3306 domain-containing protein [Roseobacter sp. H9]
MTAPASFWVRRRAAVEAEAAADAQAARAAQETARAEALAEKDDAEVLAEMGLPDPASLKQGDDFAGFMSREVPEHLRRQALRTLWRSNPVLACVDGLNDYDDDYRAATLLNEPIKTAYQVGKGMMAHIEEMERLASAVEAGDTDTLGVAEGGKSAVTRSQETLKDAQTAAADVARTADPEPTESDPVDPAPRKMRFRFEEATT